MAFLARTSVDMTRSASFAGAFVGLLALRWSVALM
jgi:hypothetical protein